MHVDDLFASQLGLATRAQLRAAGASDAAISWRTTRQWRVVLPGVILNNNGSLRPHQRIMAAQLYAGPFAQVTGQAACGLHGLRPGKAGCARPRAGHLP